METNVKDVAAGAFFIAIGAWFSLNAWLTLSLGSASQMGAGYFPILLGILLCILGVAIVLNSFNSSFSSTGGLPLRGIILVGLAPIIFGLTIRGLGLMGATMLSILAASFSSTRVTLKTGLLITIGLTAFCVLVFHYGLGLPIDLFGPWLTQLRF